MRTIGFLVMLAGFIPAFMTATTTDGMFVFIDYASAIMGFLGACTIWEKRDDLSRYGR